MRDLRRIVQAVVGALLLIGAIGAGAIWLVRPLLNRPNALFENSLIAGAGALALVYGLVLLTQAFRDEDDWAPWPPPVLMLVLWFAILMLGEYILATAAVDVAASWIFPALHALAVGLPVLAVLALVMRRTGAPAGRAALQLVFGGTVAIAVSLLAELGLLITLGALAVALLPQPPALADVVRPILSGNLRDLGLLLDNRLILVFVFIARVIFAPLIEEAAKALTLPWWPRWGLTRERAVVWGLAAGLGFALTEGMFSTLPAVTAGSWWPSLLTRGGVALLHGLVTALVGITFWRAYARRRPLNLLLGYVVAVGVHGLWNLAALARALVGDTPLGTQTTTEPALDILTADLLSFFALLAILGLAVLLFRYTARQRWAEG